MNRSVEKSGARVARCCAQPRLLVRVAERARDLGHALLDRAVGQARVADDLHLTAAVGHPHDAAGAHHLGRRHAEVLLPHAVDPVAHAPDERVQLGAREILVQLDPVAGGADASDDPPVVARRRRSCPPRAGARTGPAARTAVMTSRTRSSSFSRRDPSDAHELRRARLPRQRRGHHGHRRVDGARGDPVARPRLPARPVGVHQRDVAAHRVGRESGQRHAEPVVRRQQKSKVVPAQVDRRARKHVPRVVHVLHADRAEVGLVVGGDRDVVVR